MKFGIYTTFYNCERFIDKIFSSIESISYEDFEWHITDDYSSDDTKRLMLSRLERSPIKHKILYCEQTGKKQMYWRPDLFFDNTFDWIVVVDSDDIVDSGFLSIYNNIIGSDKEITLISSDFHKIYENNKDLHSISYIINDEDLSKKINRYHICRF